jgi:hypothetical protein
MASPTEGDAGNILMLSTNDLSMYQARLSTSSNPLSSENMVSSNLLFHTDYFLTLAENSLDPLSELQFSDAAFSARETAVNSSRHTLERGFDRTPNKNVETEPEPEPEPHWIEEFMFSGLNVGPQPWGTL